MKNVKMESPYDVTLVTRYVDTVQNRIIGYRTGADPELDFGGP